MKKLISKTINTIKNNSLVQETYNESALEAKQTLLALGRVTAATATSCTRATTLVATGSAVVAEGVSESLGWANDRMPTREEMREYFRSIEMEEEGEIPVDNTVDNSSEQAEK